MTEHWARDRTRKIPCSVIQGNFHKFWDYYVWDQTNGSICCIFVTLSNCEYNNLLPNVRKIEFKKYCNFRNDAGYFDYVASHKSLFEFAVNSWKIIKLSVMVKKMKRFSIISHLFT